MGGTDLANEICQYYNHTHRSVKWWKRVFFNMLNICILNATVIFNSVPTKKHISNLDFRIKVVEGLLVGWERNTLLGCRRSTVSNLPVRLIQKCIILAKTFRGGNVTVLFVATANYAIENKRG